jgi:hypothetical protein
VRCAGEAPPRVDPGLTNPRTRQRRPFAKGGARIHQCRARKHSARRVSHSMTAK